jgi:iron complex transport system permease protein
LFQSLLHNPLASPDVVGVTGGASVAAVVAILLLGLGGWAVPGSAAGGALAVAAVIYALAGRGGVAGQRFVLVGVAVAFLVNAVLGYALTRARVQDAQVALAWLVGGVGSAQWREVGVTALGLALLSIPTLLGRRSLQALQLGDEIAQTLGVPVHRHRSALLIIAVGLAAVGTAAAGPLAFVAFVCPAVARALLRDGSPALLASALTGAVLVAGADFAGQHLLPGGTQLPAGVLTGAVGAPYLLWLLARGGRAGNGVPV